MQPKPYGGNNSRYRGISYISQKFAWLNCMSKSQLSTPGAYKHRIELVI